MIVNVEHGDFEMIIFLGPLVGLFAANFLYQAFGAQDWAVAIDRSWFQGVAILAVWLVAAFKTAFE